MVCGRYSSTVIMIVLVKEVTGDTAIGSLSLAVGLVSSDPKDLKKNAFIMNMCKLSTIPSKTQRTI